MDRKKFDFASSSFFYSADEWNLVDLTDDSVPIVGTDTHKIIRLGTKNIIEAPEKSFKTTFFQRMALGISVGKTVYKDFPVAQKARVLYFHGELTPAELAERRRSAISSIPGFVGDNYFEGRSIHAHFINPDGQKDIMAHVKKYQPKDELPYIVVFDPWQAFITGYDENSYKDMSTATKFIDKLMIETRSTTFIQMHLGKDHSKGARGHSSVAGWKDSTIRLTRKGDINLLVHVEPRWGEKLEFGLVFNNGTMHDKTIFTPQAMRIRQLVEVAGGRLAIEDFAKVIGGSEESIRQAISRATREKAIAKYNNGDLGLPWEETEWDITQL